MIFPRIPYVEWYSDRGTCAKMSLTAPLIAPGIAMEHGGDVALVRRAVLRKQFLPYQVGCYQHSSVQVIEILVRFEATHPRIYVDHGHVGTT